MVTRQLQQRERKAVPSGTKGHFRENKLKQHGATQNVDVAAYDQFDDSVVRGFSEKSRDSSRVDIVSAHIPPHPHPFTACWPAFQLPDPAFHFLRISLASGICSVHSHRRPEMPGDKHSLGKGRKQRPMETAGQIPQLPQPLSGITEVCVLYWLSDFPSGI